MMRSGCEVGENEGSVPEIAEEYEREVVCSMLCPAKYHTRPPPTRNVSASKAIFLLGPFPLQEPSRDPNPSVRRPELGINGSF